MPHPISLDLQIKQKPSLKQTQRLMMTAQMQQAINLLQMPVLELSAAIETELQQNPIIEFLDEKEEGENSFETPDLDLDKAVESKEQPPEKELSFNENDFEILKKLDDEFREPFSESNYASFHSDDEAKLRSFQESSICSETSLFEYLMIQAHETFSDIEELTMAEAIIGNLDENGFLKTPLEEIALLNSFAVKKLKKLLNQIQSFEPYGIAASNLQESLLIQLRCQQKQSSLAYKIIENHYEDLIHNRIPNIKKNLNCSSEQISQILKKDISSLDLHPGFGHFKHFIQYITPDATIEVDEERLKIRINDDLIPPIRINRHYLRMLLDEKLASDTKEFIKHKLATVHWLFHNVHQRNETLFKIMEVLIDLQKDFFLDLRAH